MTNAVESECLNLCIARHMARIYGECEAKAIFKVAKRIRDTTRDAKLYELAKMYTVNLAPAMVGGKLLTGAQLKVMSVSNLEKGMRQEGVL